MATRWLEFGTKGDKKWPKWRRSVAVAEDGRIFIPADVTGDEQGSFMCASYDGETCIVDSGHVYLPTNWIRREFPRLVEVCDSVERRVREKISKESGS